MLVIWDTVSGIPIKSIFNPHPHGVIAMDISPDALFIVTLSAPAESDNNDPQMMSLWEWTHPEREEALFTSVIDEPDVQKVRGYGSSSYMLSIFIACLRYFLVCAQSRSNIVMGDDLPAEYEP